MAIMETRILNIVQLLLLISAGCVVSANRCLRYQVYGSMLDEAEAVEGYYGRNISLQECGYIYPHDQEANLYLYGYEYRLLEDDKAIARTPCSANRSEWLAYTARNRGFEYGYSEGWVPATELQVKCSDCQEITTNYSGIVQAADYKKQANATCNNKPVYFSSSVNMYIFYHPYPIENITDENITGWLVGPKPCNPEGIVAAGTGLEDQTAEPWEVRIWLLKYYYGWDYAFLLARCSKCEQQSVTGSSSINDQFLGVYDKDIDQNCPERRIYRKQNATEGFIIQQDTPDTDLAPWIFVVDSDDPCGRYDIERNDTYRSIPVESLDESLDAHEVPWEEYIIGDHWWESPSLRIVCTEREPGSFAYLIAAIVGFILGILLLIGLGIFIYLAVVGTITVCCCTQQCQKKTVTPGAVAYKEDSIPVVPAQQMSSIPMDDPPPYYGKL